MASSSPDSIWECGSCSHSNKGGHLKRKTVLDALVAGVAAPTAVFAEPLAVAKAILSVPTPRAVIGMPASVAKKTKKAKKLSKESSPAPMAVIAAPAPVAKAHAPAAAVAMPAPVAKG